MIRLRHVLALCALLLAAPAHAQFWPPNPGPVYWPPASSGGGGTITGSGAAGQCSLWDGASALIGDTGCTYTGTGATFTLEVPLLNAKLVAGTGSVVFSGPTATRTITVPDANFTVATTNFTLNPQTGATYTTLATDSCASGIITNVGNAGTLAITLLNDPPANTRPVCMCTGAAQVMTVAPSAGETMYFNGASASLVTSPASIGSCLRITPVTTGSGAIWIVTSYTGPLS
jgi:hypothetical protein